jgi:hypothetical protein
LDEARKVTVGIASPNEMGQPRKCIVSFRDRDGVEHVAEVTAESLYEAAARALQQFQRCEWSREVSLDTATLRVEVCESTFYNVEGRGARGMAQKNGRNAA